MLEMVLKIRYIQHALSSSTAFNVMKLIFGHTEIESGFRFEKASIINSLLITAHGLKPVKILSEYEKNVCAFQMNNAASVHDLTTRLEEVQLL